MISIKSILSIFELSKPDLKFNEFAVPRKEKHINKKINPKTNRMKKFKTTKWLITTIKPEERTLKNLPRDSKGNSKVRFQDWLELKNTSRSKYSVGQAADGKWYGWSHRAVHGFGIGDLISNDTIGNKYQYGEDIDEKTKNMSFDERDEYIKNLKFEPYKIKTDQEAFEHAERFSRDVS